MAVGAAGPDVSTLTEPPQEQASSHALTMDLASSHFARSVFFRLNRPPSVPDVYIGQLRFSNCGEAHRLRTSSVQRSAANAMATMTAV